MDIRYIKDLLAVAECGSYAKAAKARFMDQTTLSRHIAALERELGLTLVVHDGTARLTSQATRLLPGILAVDRAVSELEEQVKGLVDEEHNTVRLACWPVETTARNLVIEAMARARENDVPLGVANVEMGERDPFEVLEAGEADLALVMGDEQFKGNPSYAFKKIIKRRLCALTKVELPTREDGMIDLAVLDGCSIPFPVTPERMKIGTKIVDFVRSNGVELRLVYYDGDAIIPSSNNTSPRFVWLMPQDRISDASLVPPLVFDNTRHYVVSGDCDAVDVYAVWKASDARPGTVALADELREVS